MKSPKKLLFNEVINILVWISAYYLGKKNQHQNTWSSIVDTSTGVLEVLLYYRIQGSVSYDAGF